MIDTVSHGQITRVGITIAFGLTIVTMIYATGHISGAHINPAVALAFALTRHFPLWRVPLYWVAQVLGAIAAALVLRGMFGTLSHVGATLPAGSDGQPEEQAS